jgi:PAS domain S-box-containing protein
MPRLSAVMIGSVDTAGQRDLPSVPSSPRAHPKSYHPHALPSQWLAVDGGTDLRARARQIQRSWESLLAGGALNAELSPQATAELRPAIVDSWRRSLATGLDPTDLLPSIEADPYETRERWLEHPLGSLTHVLVAQLQQLVRESESLVQVTDPSGLTLHLDGVEWLKEQAAEMNLVEGARCSETVNGTNGVGTALAVNHPVQVFAFEHFSHHHREWVCSGAPIHDPVSGRLVGVIDLSSPWKIAHPRSLELVTTAARTMEQCLFENRRDQDARLRRRYGDLATKGTDLLVNRDGYVLVGDNSSHPEPLDVPESGGEIAMDDGSLAVAEPLGHGEAYLVRRIGPCAFGAARTKALERAEGRAHEEAGGRRRDANVESGRPSAEPGRHAVSAYFEAALDCVIVADASGRVVEFNPAAERTFGYSRDEALGRTMAELIVPPSLRERHSTAFARFIETGHGTMLGRRLELTGMRADGSEFPVELALGQVEAEPFLICGALRDISAAKQAERHLRELADEQAALRRVATLVARESSPQQLFATVAEQVARVIDVPLVRLVRYESEGSAAELVGGWSKNVDPLALGTHWQLDGPGVLADVWQGGRPARLDDYTDVPGEAAAVVRRAGMRSAVASPITVEGRLWGAIAVLSARHVPLPENTEARLADFTELVATAIANAESRAAIARLADEQAALRRVATLVASRVRPADIFSAVSEEVQRLFGLREETLDVATVVRFDPGPEFTLVGAAKSIEGLPLGTRWGPNDHYVSTRVHRTGRFARVDEADIVSAGGPGAETLRRQGLISQVASPIIVEGYLWGAITVNAREKLPPDTEERLERFTELVATAIANTESRTELAASEGHARKLAGEQAALRRVATLVARESLPEELFAVVAEEVGRVMNVPLVALARYEPDGSAIQLVGGWSEGALPVPIGGRYLLDGPSAFVSVWQTRKPARTGDSTDLPGEIAAARRQAGLNSSVASPILVEGRLWGVISVASSEPLPEDTDARLPDFTELVATAIANSEARDDLRRLFDEQDALRRVATLVAEGARAEEVFSAAAREVARVFDVRLVTVCRFESDAVVVLSSLGVPELASGSRWSLDTPGLPITIYEPGRPARIDDFSVALGLDALAREAGVTAAVGVPIVVDGSVWGSINVATIQGGSFPPDAEQRLARFTELIATAVSNATMRVEVAASRARVIAAGDETRRRIERDLHDGAQQQLVTLALGLRSAERRVPAGLDDLRTEVGRFADRLTSVIEELREMSRGIHPAILTEGGLSPAVEALALRSPVPVKLNVRSERRLPDGIEVAAYYVVSEALTNAAKYADASRVQIDLHVEEGTLCLSVVDDGAGGADPSGGSGLIGLKDRVEALGGTIDVASPPGSGTRLDVEIPLLGDPSVASTSKPLSGV